MSLTNITQVRNHLYRLNLGEGSIRNQSIRLVALQYATLPHSRIVQGSESVKSPGTDTPVSDRLTLGSLPVSLNQKPVISGTVVCASDDSLTTIFQENVDYAVDYANGTINRIDGGEIVSGAAVTLWYEYYRIYQKDVDYTIDYDRGRIRRLAGGAIEDGQELLVDYGLGDTEFTDTEIAQCIAEAEAEITRLIDPVWQESADPALAAAGTFLALSHLCRDSAAITSAGISGTGTASSVWISLSQSYRETALRLIAWFGRKGQSLKPPRLA